MSDFSDLKSMTDDIVPVGTAERERRVEKARGLMVAHGIDALYVESGTSLFYFSGLQWSCSERVTAAIIPVHGGITYVCPAFEEARLRQSPPLDGDVRTWHEHESPFALVAQVFADLGRASGTIAVEPQVRFFLYDGIRTAAPRARYVSADCVTAGCRAVKSPIEIALMQRAMDVTVMAYRKAIAMLRPGMSQDECRANAAASHRALGAAGGIDFQFGPATALPHGSREPQVLREGEVVLMDGGCTIEGYHSDISRTIVFGEPTRRQRDVWELEKRAQAAGFAAAQVGAPCEAVDAAARKVIVDAGFGPDYQLPGLPHRTGHGIGLDVHEPENMVRGNMTPLAPGMCFTVEPMIAIDGEFGVRLEDCVYMTCDGPRWFTEPSPAIDQPFTCATYKEKT